MYPEVEVVFLLCRFLFTGRSDLVGPQELYD